MRIIKIERELDSHHRMLTPRINNWFPKAIREQYSARHIILNCFVTTIHSLRITISL